MKKSIFILFVFFSFAVKAQVSTKLELDFKLSAWATVDKVVSLPYETSFNIGNALLTGFEASGWYSLNRYIGIGIAGGKSKISENTYYEFLDTLQYGEYSYFEDYNSYYGAFGIKYNIYHKKRISIYTVGFVSYNFHQLKYHDYLTVNYGDYPFTHELLFIESTNTEQSSSIGGSIGLGTRINFGRRFGMLLETHYVNNGFYKGPKVQFGLFLDLIKR